VDFRYTEEQQALQETLRRFIARDYGFERRRVLARSEPGFCRAAWQRYAELGLLALPLPEQYGGLGGNGVDVMALMEVVGEGLLLEPLLSTVVLCGGLLRDHGSEEQRRQLLPQIASGTLQMALAAYEPGARYELSQVQTTATRTAGGWQLTGHKSVVLDAPSADYFLVSARVADEPEAQAGMKLFLVPRTLVGVQVLPYATQHGGRAGDLTLAGVQLADDAAVGARADALEVLQRTIDLGIAALCAEACGIVAALNQATLAYLKSRKQFGAPIGVFQALQHRMADMYIAEQQCRSMAVIAAIRADDANARVRKQALAAAKAYVGRAARFVGQQAVQLHGGMGVVDEMIVSHYFKRLTMIDMTFGDADFHLARFSDGLYREAPTH
jgi:alkylation response protein AidB-like acyl-CoA dehydrogenase